MFSLLAERWVSRKDFPRLESDSSSLYPVNIDISVALIIFAATIGLSLLGLYSSPKIIERNLFRPYWLARGKQYETVITSGFVHADLMHLIFNMVTYYFFAFQLQDRIGGACGLDRSRSGSR